MCGSQDNQFNLSCSKTLLKILTWHLQVKADDFRGPDQFGFKKGRGTCDAMAALRVKPQCMFAMYISKRHLTELTVLS